MYFKYALGIFKHKIKINFLATSSLLLASGLATSGDIPRIQVPNTSGIAGNTANHYKRYKRDEPGFEIQFFKKISYKIGLGTILIQTNCCYNLPNIGSASLMVDDVKVGLEQTGRMFHTWLIA
ncbi:hypothetical protein AX774_g3767 [Zancudomyces culisetae]|uniref:Uncharacterized protein n=1 Tax=Zancudomyces culisetae TaxID=1213189 RepID=A0A1R1PP37_ZANCU|nr:hypothetical protein AX774_g3767 [Zancudomyces culisetae]|eukprot:OMH82746.1 hypothetical protein AX774_g3767 [Zancudomyces culisetae]